MEHLIIRGETPEDYGAIRSLIVETFRAAYGTGDPRREADLAVERLRDQSAFGIAEPITAPRFGFVPIGQFHLHTVFLSEYDMALALDDGALDAVSGLVDYPAPWDALRDE